MVPRRELAGIAASLAVGVGLLVGCSASEASEASQASGGTSPAPTPTMTASSTASSTATPVAPALRFTAPLVGGGEFDAAALAGSPVAFWFWAPT